MPKKHADTIFKALGRHPISDNKKDEDESEDDSLDYDYNDEEDHDSEDVGEDDDSEKSEDSSDEDSTGELSESDEEPIPEEFIWRHLKTNLFLILVTAFNRAVKLQNIVLCML